MLQSLGREDDRDKVGGQEGGWCSGRWFGAFGEAVFNGYEDPTMSCGFLVWGLGCGVGWWLSGLGVVG